MPRQASVYNVHIFYVLFGRNLSLCHEEGLKYLFSIVNAIDIFDP